MVKYKFPSPISSFKNLSHGWRIIIFIQEYNISMKTGKRRGCGLLLFKKIRTQKIPLKPKFSCLSSKTGASGEK